MNDAANWAAIISAVAAAIAALVSFWQASVFRRQVTRDFKHRLVAEAISQSPYLSESFQAAERTVNAWRDANLIGSEAIPELFARTSFEADEVLFRAWRTMLNHWGRMATAYYSGVIDQEVARKMYSSGFLSFMGRYESFIKSKMSSVTYQDTFKLFSEWTTSSSTNVTRLPKTFGGPNVSP